MHFYRSLLYFILISSFIAACNSQPDPANVAQGKWNITSMTLSDNPLDASMLEGSFFEFGLNGEFTDNIMGDRGKGTFTLMPEGKGFIVNYEGQEMEKEEYTFNEISDNKMVLSGQSHGMSRTLILERAAN